MKITRFDRSKKGNLQGVGIRKNMRVFDTDGKYQIWFFGWLIEI
jgi:hypothetical protein